MADELARFQAELEQAEADLEQSTSAQTAPEQESARKRKGKQARKKKVSNEEQQKYDRQSDNNDPYAKVDVTDPAYAQWYAQWYAYHYQQDQERASLAQGNAALAAASVSNAYGTEALTQCSDTAHNKQPKAHLRTAGGEVWKDETLNEWPEHDHRIFVGGLGPDTTDEMLTNMFLQYPSFAKAKVIKDKAGKSKGFGFVSLLDTKDYIAAMREMNGKYCGNRPMKLKKSTWDKREIKSKSQYKKIKKELRKVEHLKDV
eukprot:Clim_evm60s153 gene=Clim_evmTU60s153